MRVVRIAGERAVGGLLRTLGHVRELTIGGGDEQRLIRGEQPCFQPIEICSHRGKARQPKQRPRISFVDDRRLVEVFLGALEIAFCQRPLPLVEELAGSGRRRLRVRAAGRVDQARQVPGVLAPERGDRHSEQPEHNQEDQPAQGLRSGRGRSRKTRITEPLFVVRVAADPCVTRDDVLVVVLPSRLRVVGMRRLGRPRGRALRCARGTIVCRSLSLRGALRTRRAASALAAVVRRGVRVHASAHGFAVSCSKTLQIEGRAFGRRTRGHGGSRRQVRSEAGLRIRGSGTPSGAPLMGRGGCTRGMRGVRGGGIRPDGAFGSFGGVQTRGGPRSCGERRMRRIRLWPWRRRGTSVGRRGEPQAVSSHLFRRWRRR